MKIFDFFNRCKLESIFDIDFDSSGALICPSEYSGGRNIKNQLLVKYKLTDDDRIIRVEGPGTTNSGIKYLTMIWIRVPFDNDRHVTAIVIYDWYHTGFRFYTGSNLASLRWSSKDWMLFDHYFHDLNSLYSFMYPILKKHVFIKFISEIISKKGDFSDQIKFLGNNFSGCVFPTCKSTIRRLLIKELDGKVLNLTTDWKKVLRNICLRYNKILPEGLVYLGKDKKVRYEYFSEKVTDESIRRFSFTIHKNFSRIFNDEHFEKYYYDFNLPYYDVNSGKLRFDRETISRLIAFHYEYEKI